MGIFKCSYNGVSSVSTVTRLPEAHTLLFVVARRPALGRTEPDIQHILARAFPWGKAVDDKFTTHLHLVPKQKFRGVTPPFPTYLYVFVFNLLAPEFYI